MRRIIPILLLAILDLSAPVMADVSWLGELAGACIQTDNNRFIGATDDGLGSCDSNELVLAGRWEPTRRWAFSAQGLARNAGELDDKHFHLSQAFGEYLVYAGQNQDHVLRFGRMTLPLGFYNETRDIASTRPSIILPQSIYFERARMLLAGQDGLSWDSTYMSDIGSTQLRAGRWFHKANVDEADVDTYLFGADQPGSFSNKGDGWFFVADHQWNSLHLRWSVVSGVFNYKPAPGEIRGSGESQSFASTVSAHYQVGLSHTITAEHQIGSGKSIDYDPIPDFIARWDGTYVQYNYLLDNSTIYARYDYFRYDDDTSDILQAIGQPQHATYSKDAMIGYRYHFDSQVTLSAEYHKLKGTGWLSRVENPIPGDTAKNWDLFALQLVIGF